jgi:hypothetical protein
MGPGVPFFRYLGMSKTTYRQCKLAYRQGGLKRSMPVYEGAPEMTHEFRKDGAEVWLCTTRPYLRLDNIDPDTRHWLRRNHIQWDGVIFGPHKYNDLVRQVPKASVIAVLDDLPEQCAAANSLGLPVSVRNQPYNKDVEGYPRVYDFFIDSWKWSIRNLIEMQRTQ